MTGVGCGFDMASLLAIAAARGMDAGIAAILLPHIEAGMIAGIGKQADKGGEDASDGKS